MPSTSRSSVSKSAPLGSATYSMAQTAALCGVSYSKIWEMVREESFPLTPLRIGRQYKFLKSDVHQLLGLHDDPEEGVA